LGQGHYAEREPTGRIGALSEDDIGKQTIRQHAWDVIVNYLQCRNVFPTLRDFRLPGKVGPRAFAVNQIDSGDAIVLAKLAEMVEMIPVDAAAEDVSLAVYSLDALQWMYIVADQKERARAIAGYKEIIEQINTEVEV
jgi:hypothetical protein